MIVVADTSPLNYLVQIECDHLLQRLYERIVVPSSVLRELGDVAAPEAIKKWLDQIPVLIDVATSRSPPDHSLGYLGNGEREAIQLAAEWRADLLLIDERKGRLEARRRGFRTTGTLGVLLAAQGLELVDAACAYRRLVGETTFRTSPTLEEQFLRQTRLRT